MDLKNFEKICACKGIRMCTICENLKANLKEDNEHNNLLKYFYCQNCLECHLLKKYSDLKDVSSCCNDSLDENISVDGIFLIQNFITEQEEMFLLKEMNKNKWVDSQSGRYKQDYGPKVNFKKKKLKLERFTGLPFYSQVLTERLKTIDDATIKSAEFHPVELCNLKYESERGASIDSHFDDFWLWGDRLVTINCLSDSYLTLTPSEEVNVKNCEIFIPLKRFSLIILHSDARYKWMHSIKRSHIKDTRVAITLRELSEEFKNGQKGADLGQNLKEIALSFKGITIGELEDYFNNQVDNNSTQSMRKPDINSKEIIISLKNDLNAFFEIETRLVNLNFINMNELKSSTYMIEYNTEKQYIAKIVKKRDTFYFIRDFLHNTSFKHENFRLPRLLTCGELNAPNHEYNYLIYDKVDGELLSFLIQTKLSATADEIFFQIGKIVAHWKVSSLEFNKLNFENFRCYVDFFNFYSHDYSNLIYNSIKTLNISNIQKSLLYASFRIFQDQINSIQNDVNSRDVDDTKSLNIIGMIHGEINLKNIVMLDDDWEYGKSKLLNFEIIKFSKLNISLYIHDLANCICDCIIQIVSTDNLKLKDKNACLRIKSIYENILNGYKTIFKDELIDKSLLNNCILNRLTLHIIKYELDYCNFKSNNKEMSEKIINSCWSLFDILFFNKLDIF